jgi:hypothetical protein
MCLYFQGLNRIVAILLLFLSEEDAFWGLVYIVEKLMPSDYYGPQLAGAQIDQVSARARSFHLYICEIF